MTAVPETAPATTPLGLIPAAKYRRISNDPEGRELGISRQDEDLDALAAKHNLIYVASYCDNDISASTRTRKIRKQYQQMLKDAKAGNFKVIAACTTGRLTRKPREVEGQIELAEQHGISYMYDRSPVFDLNTAYGRLVARQFAAWDAGEAEIISERVTRARLQQAKEGRFGGGRRRFGWGMPLLDPKTGEVVIDHDQMVDFEIDEIKKMGAYLLAGKSMRYVIRDLTDRGVETAGGGKWTAIAVRDIMLRPALAGMVKYRGEILEGAKVSWEPIIPVEQWKALRAMLKDPRRKTTTGNTPKWLLSHVAVCGSPVCEGKGNRLRVTGMPSGGNTGRTYPSYRCIEVAHCNMRADKLDAEVEHIIIERLSRPDAINLVEQVDEIDIKFLASEGNALRAHLEEAKGAYKRRLLTLADLIEVTEDVNLKLADIERRLAEATSLDPLAGLIGRPDVAERWNELDLGQKKAIINSLMTITILPSFQRGGRLPGGGYIDQRRLVIDWKRG